MKVYEHSSFAYAVEPRAFEQNGVLHNVVTITYQWRTPGELHFYVRDDRNEFFELTYAEQTEQWSLREFGKTCPPKRA